MNLQLRQFTEAFYEYGKTLAAVTSVDTPEYYAWISMLDKGQWPKEGEFQKARIDTDFRAFRAAYKQLFELLPTLAYTECRIFQLIFKDSIMPFEKEFQQRYLREIKGGVPF